MNKLFKFISFLLWVMLLFVLLPFWVGLLVMILLLIGNRTDRVILIGSTVFIQTKMPNMWGAQATTIAPFLVLTDSLDITDALVRNEQCHSERHYPSMLWFGFYIVYPLFYLMGYDYDTHPLEVDSRKAEKEGYLESTGIYEWRKYL